MSEFDPKSLLTPPDVAPAPLSVNELAAKLAKIKAMGLGGAPMCLPDGSHVVSIEIAASGETPAHFVLKGQAPK